MAKRVKNVYTMREVPHQWIHSSHRSARDGNKHLFFEGETVYSYGHHFPIATIIRSKGRGKVLETKVGPVTGIAAILFTTRGYSNTTSKHIGYVRQAIPRDVKIFNVPLGRGLDTESAVHFRHYQSEIDNEFQKAKSGRDYSPHHYERMLEFFQEAKDYARFFRIPLRAKLPVTGKKLAKFKAECEARKLRAEEMAKSRAERQPELDRKRREKFEKRNAEMIAQLHQMAEDWKTGKSDNPPSRYWPGFRRSRHYEGIGPVIPTMLRIKGDEVQTSMGARFPVSHAIRGLALVESCMSSKREYQRNGHTVHLGNYAIDRVTVEGTVYAGCHVVEWAEISRIKPELLQRAAMIAQVDQTREYDADSPRYDG